MCEIGDDDLRDLLARKKKLLEMKRMIIERSADTSESFIENSDIEADSDNRPNIIVNDSNETICTIEDENMDIINTSTMSLPRSHSFFNISGDSTTGANNRQFSKKTDGTNSDAILMLNVTDEHQQSHDNETTDIILSLAEVEDNLDILHNSTKVTTNISEETVPENLITAQEECEVMSPTTLINYVMIDSQNILSEEPKSHDSIFPIASTSHDDLIFNESEMGSNRGTNVRKKRHITSTFTKSCMDFYIDDQNEDFSSGSSDIWSRKESSSEESDGNKKNKKLKKTKPKNDQIPSKRKRPENKRKTRKHLKEKGLTYETSSGKLREARKLQENPCKEGKCSRRCFEITEERRNAIFNYFWGLTDEKKRDWIVQCCRTAEIKRKKTKNAASRRSLTYEYYINEGEGRKQVCQQFILKTLNVSQTFVLYNIGHAQEGLSGSESRTRTAPNIYDEQTKNDAKKYIESLPALPSHYSRKNSTKLYLPEHFRNASNLYRLYAKHCHQTSKKNLSEKLFKNLFAEYNLAFHIPKKDKCTLCTKYENNPDTTINDELRNHLLEKDATYKRFKIHQNLKPDETLLVASFDLQKVLGTPYGESMLLYYSRKYAVYNFTVYESRTQNGCCYTWGESDGKRGSCEIATCLFRYLKEVDSRGLKTLLLYCDNCTGQNKNKVVLSMFNYFLRRSVNLQVIQINYLLAGHTYMPVDSMHAVIEREVKNLIVWAPSQWPTFMETSRKQPHPYHVNVVDHTEFIDFNNIADTVFTPATLKDKNLHLRNIRVCTFKKNSLDRMEVKYTMLENESPFSIELAKQEQGKGKGIGKRASTRSKQTKKTDDINQDTLKIINFDAVQCDLDNLPHLYKEKLPISIPKYKDLKKLCDSGVIPKRFHSEYLNLPNKAPVKDSLNDTDEDDILDTPDEAV